MSTAVATSPRQVIFRARRPAMLVYPLAAVTETAGILTIAITHQSIGWFMCAAPFAALVVTGALVRPSIELTRNGIVQRQYPFSTLTRWDVIDVVDIVRAGNRIVLAYKLQDGIPPPRRQPAAALLRVANQPFDGGYFADSLAVDNPELLATVRLYLADEGLRQTLPSH